MGVLLCFCHKCEVPGAVRNGVLHRVKASHEERRGQWEPHGEGDKMYRSVIESEQEGSERRRLWRWVEGVLVAVVVVVGVTYLFGLLTF